MMIRQKQQKLPRARLKWAYKEHTALLALWLRFVPQVLLWNKKSLQKDQDIGFN